MDGEFMVESPDGLDLAFSGVGGKVAVVERKRRVGDPGVEGFVEKLVVVREICEVIEKDVEPVRNYFA